jgi:hypothetical protein
MRAPHFAGLSLRAELIFLLHKKTERLTESLTDASQLAGSGRSRIVGCCNLLGCAMWTCPMLLGFLLCSQHRNAFALVNNSCSAGLDRNRRCLRVQLLFNLLVVLSRRSPQSCGAAEGAGGVEAGSGVLGASSSSSTAAGAHKTKRGAVELDDGVGAIARGGMQAQRAWRPSPARRVPKRENNHLFVHCRFTVFGSI